MTIAERLKEERERLGLSQPRFGELAKVVKQTVIQWEKGASAPDAVQLSLFRDAGADILYILTGRRMGEVESVESNQINQNVQPYGLSNDEATLIENYRRSTPDVQAAALRMLAGMTEKIEKPVRPPPSRPSAHEFGPSGDTKSRPRFIGEETEPSSRKRKK